jgi:hypothetical protein
VKIIVIAFLHPKNHGVFSHPVLVAILLSTTQTPIKRATMSDNNKDDRGHNGRPSVTPTPNKRVQHTGLQMLVNAGSIYDMRNSSTRSSTTTSHDMTARSSTSTSKDPSEEADTTTEEDDSPPTKSATVATPRRLEVIFTGGSDDPPGFYIVVALSLGSCWLCPHTGPDER